MANRRLMHAMAWVIQESMSPKYKATHDQNAMYGQERTGQEGEAATVGTYSRSSSQFKSNYLTDMCSGSEEGSYSRHMDMCITQL